jgi:hypothetical protein
MGRSETAGSFGCSKEETQAERRRTRCDYRRYKEALGGEESGSEAVIWIAWAAALPRHSRLQSMYSPTGCWSGSPCASGFHSRKKSEGSGGAMGDGRSAVRRSEAKCQISKSILF